MTLCKRHADSGTNFADMFFDSFLAGIRYGIYSCQKYLAGYIWYTPVIKQKTDDYAGAWLTPDQTFCNPLGWFTASKMALNHCGIEGNKRAGALFSKTVVCVNAICTGQDAGCHPVKCYTYKVPP